MKRIFRVSLGLSIIASLIYPAPATAVLANPATSCVGSTCTVTFSDASDFYNYTVPTGLTFVNVTLRGGAGGGSGGQGGVVTGRLNISGGSVLTIYVGGAGTQGSAPAGGLSGGRSSGGAAASGGRSDSRSGGGHSEIIFSGVSLVIAGGGGGQGGWSGGTGGVGGGATWVSGIANGGNGSAGQAQPGTGGTSTVGTGGSANAGASAGSAGSGQVGGTGGAGSAGSGGGGGGGYRGGGGGGGDTDVNGVDGGGGGGGSSFYHTSYFSTAPTTTAGGNAGAGSIVISYPSTAVSTFTSTHASRTNTTSAISYALRMSENVTGMEAVDFENSGTATGCVFAVTGSNDSYTVTITSCSEGTLIPALKANSVTGTTAGPAAVSPATSTIIIDRTAPTILSVTAPANATYKPSDTPTFLVNFSESVTVTGSPRLVLTVGSVTEYAIYQSMVDQRTARFRYTVVVDPLEFDTDGIAINTTLDLNSGSIADLATNSLASLGFSAPTLTSVLVAQPPGAPTIDSITATSGTLEIYFTPGAARGSTTSSYQYSANNGAWTNRPTGTTASPITLTGLTNGTGYTIRLRAVTNAGNSDTSTAVTETPTAILVSGDSTLTLTYGNSASTGAYSATGGTGTYTWSLGSSISGVTLSGSTVTASNTLAAGTYSQTVRATDGNNLVGSSSLTITVNKAATSISIALPNSSSNAALGAAVTITATVPRAGSVNFRLNGATISGCGSATAASTSATCSWTPGAMGSVSLTAIFTPTDSSNYETATSTTLSITVVTGESNVTLQLAGGVTQPPKGQPINIIATVDQAGRITFLIDGVRIPGCTNRVANVGNVTCSWRPAVQKVSTITARLIPTNNVFNPTTSSLRVQVIRRTGLR